MAALLQLLIIYVLILIGLVGCQDGLAPFLPTQEESLPLEDLDLSGLDEIDIPPTQLPPLSGTFGDRLPVAEESLEDLELGPEVTEEVQVSLMEGGLFGPPPVSFGMRKNAAIFEEKETAPTNANQKRETVPLGTSVPFGTQVPAADDSRLEHYRSVIKSIVHSYEDYSKNSEKRTLAQPTPTTTPKPANYQLPESRTLPTIRPRNKYQATQTTPQSDRFEQEIEQSPHETVPPLVTDKPDPGTSPKVLPSSTKRPRSKYYPQQNEVDPIYLISRPKVGYQAEEIPQVPAPPTIRPKSKESDSPPRYSPTSKLFELSQIPTDLHLIPEPSTESPTKSESEISFQYLIKEPFQQLEKRFIDPESGHVRGVYACLDPSTGLYRVVEYEDRGQGFQARVRSNEPGVQSYKSAGVEFEKESAL